MDYPLENLDPERFQELCQALLLQEYRGLQCFPVGQPDGGRDAWSHRLLKGKARPALFQIKFSRRADLTEDAHRRFVETMKSELAKLDQAMLKGVEKYIVLTNIPGTAHREAGSVDKLQKVLDDGLPIPGEVWWRGDIVRRLDSAWDLKWAYPEVMSGQDLLRALVESGLKDEQNRRTNAVRSFLIDQFRADQEVKFKQVELQNQLVKLFVDVPASLPERNPDRRSHLSFSTMAAYAHVSQTILQRAARNSRKAARRDVQAEDPLYSDGSFSIGAATLLLDPSFQVAFPKIMLEGAPGQGKSTIGQYVCQVHRARLLGQNDMLTRVNEGHQKGPIRLPFRIDLRDLAMWLSRRDPFNVDNDGEPPFWQKSVESFLCAHVRNASGGAEFSVSDLHAILRTSSLLLVFDGLDEVADVEMRKGLVGEIKRATTRLKDMALSIQVVVTSRPAAFANSPGFSEDSFPCFHLDSLPHTLVIDYSERWLKAKQVSEREAADLRRLLREKLDQPHMRDLARNPMQLAILLSLMHTRGPSLPDKRTALYYSYVDLFFNREAEKSQTVREHRELLIGIHGHLAWVLHCGAQEERNRGSITDERLREVVRNYLVNEGHEPTLVDVLFTGMVERVVALVSRVQGTYEFEVQPLREYFAARYLYETAQYSPVGRERRGTLPDRFDALARDFYWLNVTRFYAGFFSKGELPSLVDRLEVLFEEVPFKYTSRPRVLAAMLLADWVFTQHPRSVSTLVKLILEGAGLRVIAAALDHHRRAPMALVLSKSSGRDELVERAFVALERFPPRDYGMELVEVLRANGTYETLEKEWRNRLGRLTPANIQSWIEYGQYLGLLPHVTDAELASICHPLEPLARMQVFFSTRRAPSYVSDKDSEVALVIAILDREVCGSTFRWTGNPFECLAAVVDPFRYISAIRNKEPYPLRDSWRAFGDDGKWLDEPVTGRGAWQDILRVVSEVTKRPSSEWAKDLNLWSSIVEAIRAVRPCAWSAVTIACVAAGLVPALQDVPGASDFFDASVPLCRRMRAARRRAGQPSWWSNVLQSATSADQAMMAILAAAMCASGKTLAAIAQSLEGAMSSLTEVQWQKLVRTATSLQLQTQNLVGEKMPRTHAIAEIPTDISEKILPLFVSRGTAKARESLYFQRLAMYRGATQVMLEAVQSIAVTLMGGSRCDWKRELAVISHAYQYGNIVEGALIERLLYFTEHSHHFDSNQITMDAAALIVGEPDKYPLVLVRAAQIVYEKQASTNLTPVGVVAKNESWFENM